MDNNPRYSTRNEVFGEKAILATHSDFTEGRVRSVLNDGDNSLVDELGREKIIKKMEGKAKKPGLA